MDIQVLDIGPCKKQVKISVPYNEMEDEIKKVQLSVQQKANVPGFRIGKAPMKIVEQYYGDLIQNEIIRNVVNNSYSKAVEEKQLKPVKPPSIEDVDYKKGEKVDFKFDLEVAPEFELPKYKEVPLKKKKLTVTDEHIDAELKALAEKNAYFEPVEDRGVQMGDYIVADYNIKQKEETIDEAKQVWIEMREDFYIPKFCEGLVGMKKGEEKEVKVVLPKEFTKPELSGKKVIINVKLNEIKKKVLPEINGEFIKQIGKFNNIDELKQRIREELTAYFQQLTERDLVSQIEDYLLKNTKLDVPESVVDSFHDVLYEDTVSYLKNSGKATDDLIKEKEKDIKESTRRDAVSQVKLIYILDGIGTKENINVTDDDVDSRIESLVKRTGKSSEEIRDYLDKNNKWWDFKYRLRNEKLTKFLLDNAKVEEVEVKPEEAARK